MRILAATETVKTTQLCEWCSAEDAADQHTKLPKVSADPWVRAGLGHWLASTRWWDSLFQRVGVNWRQMRHLAVAGREPCAARAPSQPPMRGADTLGKTLHCKARSGCTGAQHLQMGHSPTRVDVHGCVPRRGSAMAWSLYLRLCLQSIRGKRPTGLAAGAWTCGSEMVAPPRWCDDGGFLVFEPAGREGDEGVSLLSNLAVDAVQFGAKRGT